MVKFRFGNLDIDEYRIMPNHFHAILVIFRIS
jgi:hypothetical protein